MSKIEQVIQEIAKLPEADQQSVIDFVEYLKKRQMSPSATRQPLDLEDEPFVGMWKDRQDMEDSSDWVRQTRQHHWGN